MPDTSATNLKTPFISVLYILLLAIDKFPLDAAGRFKVTVPPLATSTICDDVTTDGGPLPQRL